VKKGYKAKKIGEYFENLILFFAKGQRIAIIKIPEGCKVVKNRFGKLIPLLIKSPFDFFIVKSGKVACFDTKTIESGNFSFSEINQNQIRELLNIEQQGISSGYLIFYRDRNRIVFYKASIVQSIKPRESLKEEQGIAVGDNQQVNFNLILG
jgi:penicillin-binding protein-related factor A (putative recombinase)